MAASSGNLAPPITPEILARLLRHELGGFLQTVYSTVAVLQRKLPPDWNMERAVVENLMSQAEDCRALLDTVHDCVLPAAAPCWDRVDLAALAVTLAARARRRHSHLEVMAEMGEATFIFCDRNRIARLGSLLLTSACAVARQRVHFQTIHHPAAQEVEWIVTGDGPLLLPDGEPDPLASFVCNRHGHLELGLAPARNLTEAHAGRISIGKTADGGHRVHVVLPCKPPRA